VKKDFSTGKNPWTIRVSIADSSLSPLAGRMQLRSSEEELRTQRFRMLVMPHLDAGYNLARWLTRSEQDADDVLQEASIKAFRFVEQCRGENPKAWFLAIVRNAAFSWLRNNKLPELITTTDDDGNPLDLTALAADPDTPETIMLEDEARRGMDQAIAALPAVYREVLILREQEEMSYKEIAEVTGMPIGTVMSRLARARAGLAKAVGVALVPALAAD
jgi:RNA polymerase sigma-70 factor (ECF subfamily)